MPSTLLLRRLPGLALTALVAFGAGRLAISRGPAVGLESKALALASARQLSLAFQEIAHQAGQGVLSVRAEVASPRQPERFRRLAQGSGAILSADGLAVTNHHVVRGAERLRCTLADGSQLEAELLGVDPDADLALLRLKPRGETLPPLVPLGFAEEEELAVGQWVLALGNPLGLGPSVTSGIVSGLGRTDLRISKLERYVQTDAAINPGNSGGPLVDLEGRLVGINTAVGTAQGGNLGIGFAIPASIVRKFAREVQESGRPRRGWLGLRLLTLGEEEARTRGLEPRAHVLVTDFQEPSPARAAGVEKGDLILTIDGQPVTSVGELVHATSSRLPGAQTELGLWRDGLELRVAVLLEDRVLHLPADE